MSFLEDFLLSFIVRHLLSIWFDVCFIIFLCWDRSTTESSKVAHMPLKLDGSELVIAHGKSKFLTHDKVAKLLREGGGFL